MHQRLTSKTTSRLGVALVVVLVVLAGCMGGAGGADGGDASGGGSGAGANGGGQTGDGAGGNDATDEGGVGSYYDDGDRVVVRSGELSLRVEEFEEAFRQARAVALEHGGYVGDREQDADGEYDEGYFVVRVPAENFSAVRDELAALGTVTGEHVEALEFTSTYRNLSDRLETLRADERRLEQALEQGEDAAETRAQLETVREEIADLEARTTRLERRSSMSTIRVEMREPAHHRPPRHSVSATGLIDSTVDAFHAGTTVLRDVLAVLGFLTPATVAGVLVLAAGLVGIEVTWRGWRRLRDRLELYASWTAPGPPDEVDEWSTDRRRSRRGNEGSWDRNDRGDRTRFRDPDESADRPQFRDPDDSAGRPGFRDPDDSNRGSDRGPDSDRGGPGS